MPVFSFYPTGYALHVPPRSSRNCSLSSRNLTRCCWRTRRDSDGFTIRGKTKAWQWSPPRGFLEPDDVVALSLGLLPPRRNRPGRTGGLPAREPLPPSLRRARVDLRQSPVR